jgi:GDP-mannose 6-dehydrogenase
MKLSVFGIGYVGSVVAGCMAKSGHDVIAVDVNPTKVAVVVQAHRNYYGICW